MPQALNIEHKPISRRERKSKNIWLKLAKNFKFLPSKWFVKLAYQAATGQTVDFSNPITFNEKIQWYKVYYKNPLLKTLANKYLVREYVKEKIGEEYLNGLIAVYRSPKEIDFSKLPDQFALKVVHGSGYNIIVSDKSKLDQDKARKRLAKWQRTNFYLKNREWAYKNSPRLIIAEEFLSEAGKEVISDYKFFCFNGQVKFVQVDVDRKIDHARSFYDTNWQKLPFFNVENRWTSDEIEKPSNYDEMVEVARKLSEGLPFVRVDLYALNGKTYFGEMTFYPANGTKFFSPDEWNTTIGSYFVLPPKS